MTDNKELDIKKLQIDITNIKFKDFIGCEMDGSKIAQFEHNDLINDWHMEHIRRFNLTAEHLIRALQSQMNYAQLLQDGNNNIIVDNGIIDVIHEHRVACRDVCINIDIYIEVIKSFCRYYFFMDKEKTDNGKKWVDTLQQFTILKPNGVIDLFIDNCKKLFQDADTKFIALVRNNEVHNESPLELIHYEFTPPNLIPVPKEYVISNEDIHNKIVNCISLLISVTESLQEILVKIPPITVFGFLSNRNGQLKNILRVEERYKKERDYFSEFK